MSTSQSSPLAISIVVICIWIKAVEWASKSSEAVKDLQGTSVLMGRLKTSYLSYVVNGDSFGVSIFNIDAAKS